MHFLIILISKEAEIDTTDLRILTSKNILCSIIRNSTKHYLIVPVDCFYYYFGTQILDFICLALNQVKEDLPKCCTLNNEQERPLSDSGFVFERISHKSV